MNPRQYEQPILGKPGAGLPFPQNLMVRYLIGPLMSKKLTWEENEKRFSEETKKILTLIEGLSEKELLTPVLVPPMRGIEDSSRFWSIAMTLDHMMIVGNRVAEAVEILSRGEVPKAKADIAAVKPHQLDKAENVLQNFKNFESKALEVLAKVKNRESSITFDHPWFGPFKASQWFWLMGTHQAIHRAQIKKIKELLAKS